MNRLIVFCGLAVALPLFSGCALFKADPVPPAPSLTGVQAEQTAWQDKIHSSPDSDTPVFEPLSDAQDAVQAAEAQPQVDSFDSQSLSEAQSALKEAKADWQKIAKKKKRSNEALAKVAGKAHRAERLAQIAQYTAQRELSLGQLNKLQAQQRQKQQQQRRLASTAGSSGMSGSTQSQLVGRHVVPQMLGSLRFQPGTARLTQSSHSVLERLAKLVHEHSQLGIAIFGFTSNNTPPADRLKAFIGSNPKLKKQNLNQDQQVKAYHQGLSLARARDVAELLAHSGVDPDRIGVRPMGASHPVASNDSAEGRKKNARVEVIMVPLKNNGG